MKTKSPRQETEPPKRRMRLVKGSREEPISCDSCDEDLSAGWEITDPSKRPRVTCDRCGIKSGALASYELIRSDVHPWNRNPVIKGGRFAMQSKRDGQYVVSTDALGDALQARLFSAAYLNTCNWEWSAFNDAIPESELKKIIAEAKKASAKKNNTNTKERKKDR